MKYIIQGGTVVTPDEVLRSASITVDNDTIIKVGEPDRDAEFIIQLEESDLVFPGLINAHDHMLGNYYPRIGAGPYINWKPWDNDLKTAPLYKERSNISNFDLYLLASYRNIISGVTTIQDHIPHSVNKAFIDKLPLRVIKDYTLQHECSSFDLKWGKSITEEHTKAVKDDIPFITHIDEGYDEESTLGIEILKELNALDEHTVMIHGISLSEQDIIDIVERNAHMVWCPTSNWFMFKDTMDVDSMMEKGGNVALGTDSPMSGGINILEEMQFAESIYYQQYEKHLDPKTVVEMVTKNSAKALRLNRLGRIEEGYFADFTVIKNGNVEDPYRSLVSAWFDDIRMVIKAGVPLYGDRKDLETFHHFHQHYQLLEINNTERILIGKPIDLYQRIWEDVHFKKVLPFFPVDFCS